MKPKHIAEFVFLFAFVPLFISGCGKSEGNKHFSEEDALPDISPEEILADDGSVPGVFEDENTPMSAQDELKRMLTDHGIEIGYSGERIAVIGDAEMDIAPDSTLFQKQRMLCIQKALENGKRALAEYIVMTVELDNPDGVNKKERKTDNNVVASIATDLSGVRLLQTCESWYPNRPYEAAVAIAWSKKPIHVANKPLSKSQLERHMDGDIWLPGPKMLKDDDGLVHFLGIGLADANRPDAQAAAQAVAQKFATFFLPSHVVAETRYDMASKTYAKTYAETLANDSFRAMELFCRKVEPSISPRQAVLSVVEVLY